MTVHDTLQNTIVASVNQARTQAIMVQEDEVLALAAKIKRQRELDSVYLKAFNLLAQLRKDTSPSGKLELTDHNYIIVKFWHRSNTGYFDDTVVELPVQMGDDLIDHLSQYTAARTPD